MGRGILAETHVLQSRTTVSPRLIPVCYMRLVSSYTSHTACVDSRCAVIWLWMYHNNCMSAYSPNAVARCGLIMCMTAAISKTTTEASLIAEERPGLGMPGRQERMSDLVSTAVKTSSFSLSIRNCSCFTLSSPHNKGSHCTQQQANKSIWRPCPPENKKLTPDVASPAPCCIAGHAKAYLRTVDSDVMVLAVNFFQESCLEELWIGFRSWKTSKDTPIHHISQLLSIEHCQPPSPLPYVHWLWHCVRTASIRKTNSMECIACIFSDITDTLIAITKNPSSLSTDSHHIRRLERMLNVPCLPQHSSGKVTGPNPCDTVSGAGNGASGTNGGCHIGRTWMTSAKHVHFCTVVVLSPAKEIASAPE